MSDSNDMSNELITVWRGTDGDTEPVEMKCKVFGYPHRTECGDQMFVNTHFLDKEKAWESVLRSVRAYVRHYGEMVADRKAELQTTEQKAAIAAELFAKAHRKYEAWKDGR